MLALSYRECKQQYRSAVLFRKTQWAGLADGSITVAFRYQKKPTVRTGGTLQSKGGLLAIDSVDAIAPTTITNGEARRAGAASAAEVLADLGPCPDGKQLYRVRFHLLGEDPRVSLRAADDLSTAELGALLARLARLDKAAGTPWTHAVLRLIADNPGVVSTDLAPQVGMERPPFKLNVRKLKASGLTESLEIGYRVSPRGRAVLRALEA
jgi:hypothetical protein